MADEQTADSAFIFVYGGLMRGLDLHHFISSATFVCQGSVSGTLVALGRYPGLLAGAGDVRGEVYRLDDAAAGLESLDDLEEYDPADPEKSVYVRLEAEVRGDDGAVMRAWVYRYNRDAGDAPAVANGDWRRHQAER